jgi:hypothetical protein
MAENLRFFMFISIKKYSIYIHRPVGSVSTGCVCFPYPPPTLFFRRGGKTDTTGSVTMAARPCDNLQAVIHYMGRKEKKGKAQTSTRNEIKGSEKYWK